LGRAQHLPWQHEGSVRRPDDGSRADHEQRRGHHKREAGEARNDSPGQNCYTIR